MMIEPSKLTLNDVQTLIEAEKNPEFPLEYRDVYNQIVNSFIHLAGKYKCTVIDRSRDVVYKLMILCTPIKTKFSISLMFSESHYHLIRFDFGEDLRHINNYHSDNEKEILGSHVHLNAPPGKHNAKNVIPISSIDEFKNIKIIKDAFLEFIKYTNIKDEKR